MSQIAQCSEFENSGNVVLPHLLDTGDYEHI